MYIITNKKLEEIRYWIFTKENFEKFDNPDHPQYEDYKDRQTEKWFDKGNNMAIDHVLGIITGKRHIDGKRIQ